MPEKRSDAIAVQLQSVIKNLFPPNRFFIFYLSYNNQVNIDLKKPWDKKLLDKRCKHLILAKQNN